jgi:3-methyladenine DNA glycosylase/8-oxoguanine DNA glycosylase
VTTVRAEVVPPWPFRLRGGSKDGLFVRRGSAVQRLIHVGDVAVFTGAIQDRGKVVFAARAAAPGGGAAKDGGAPARAADGAAAAPGGAAPGPGMEAAADEALRRLRFAVGVDEDHREFHERFAGDRFIGRAVRAFPGLRVMRRPSPWEALAWAITEQLIEFDRACTIQRRMIAALGRRCAATGLRDSPTAAAVAGEAPARLASFDLTQSRAITLRRAALEVARGLDLDDPGAARRLARISGIGDWTLEMLALQGQGRYDQIPAGDLGYIKIIGRVTTGNPRARADIPEVRGFFERYGEWKGLAGEYMRVSASRGWLVSA